MRFVVNQLILFTHSLHGSHLIRFVAQFGAKYARSQSIVGQHVLFCAQRYHWYISYLC